MFSGFRDFLSRHRRKFLFGGIAIGTAVIAVRYTKQKFREWQERETREFIDRTRKQQHFESTERTCEQTILSLLPTVLDEVSLIFDTGKLISKLKTGSENKLQLWEELKIFVFARGTVLIYASVMLIVMLRIQLSILGGFMFKDSNCKATNVSVSSDLQQLYLSQCQHFLKHGVTKLCALIQDNVKLVVKPIPLKQEISLKDVEQIFWAIQSSIANGNDPVNNLPQYLLPLNDCYETSKNLSDSESELLKSMLSETVDLLESEEITRLISSLISQGLSQMIDRISEHYIPIDKNRSALNAPDSSRKQVETPGPYRGVPENLNNLLVKSNATFEFVHPNSISIPMAKLIPFVNGLGFPIKQGYTSEPWIKYLLCDEKLKVLSANIYEAFSHRNTA